MPGENRIYKLQLVGVKGPMFMVAVSLAKDLRSGHQQPEAWG